MSKDDYECMLMSVDDCECFKYLWMPRDEYECLQMPFTDG